MNKIFLHLNFQNVSQNNIECWVKDYKGFRLFVARNIELQTNFLASIKVLKTEILMPFAINEKWILKFHDENS